MASAVEQSGLVVEYAIDVRLKDGTLVYREASVSSPFMPAPPQMGTCENCLELFRIDMDNWVQECMEKAELFEAVRKYHKLRGIYAFFNKHNIIDEKYRTGEPSPQTILEAKQAISELRRLQGEH
uniref:Uncharacterized protein n=1 Tax=viral metagenome TaxID=1070528 RepID=A0A6M3KK38_9ZZZZ